MLRTLRVNGATLVLVTHNVDEGLALASHAAIMLAGRFARFGRVDGVDALRFAADYQSLMLGDAPPPFTRAGAGV